MAARFQIGSNDPKLRFDVLSRLYTCNHNTERVISCANARCSIPAGLDRLVAGTTLNLSDPHGLAAVLVPAL